MRRLAHRIDRSRPLVADISGGAPISSRPRASPCTPTCRSAGRHLQHPGRCSPVPSCDAVGPQTGSCQRLSWRAGPIATLIAEAPLDRGIRPKITLQLDSSSSALPCSRSTPQTARARFWRSLLEMATPTILSPPAARFLAATPRRGRRSPCREVRSSVAPGASPPLRGSDRDTSRRDAFRRRP